MKLRTFSVAALAASLAAGAPPGADHKEAPGTRADLSADIPGGYGWHEAAPHQLVTGVTLAVPAAPGLEMVTRLVGSARLVDGKVDVRVGPALVDRHHPLAAVEGAFNAVMLQGDAIREITLEGPGAGGVETASAVVADMVSIIGTTATGFLQNDPVWRSLTPLPPGELASPHYLRLEVEDRAGVLADIAQALAAESVSVARLVQQPGDGRAILHVITHEAPAGRVDAALGAIRWLPESRGDATALPVVSERGVEELGWA